jgi:hypothetical protein
LKKSLAFGFILGSILLVYGLLCLTLIIPVQIHPQNIPIFLWSDNQMWQLQGSMFASFGVVTLIAFSFMVWLERQEVAIKKTES